MKRMKAGLFLCTKSVNYYTKIKACQFIILL